MKTRQGFISNSSSSSYIIIGNQEEYITPQEFITEFTKEGVLIVDSTIGETEFGWGPNQIYGMGSRIIFSYIQTDYGCNIERLTLLEKVIREYTNISKIIWNIDSNGDDEEKDWAYIDQQSSYIEDRNLEMFDSKEKMKNFLFNKNSYIVIERFN